MNFLEDLFLITICEKQFMKNLKKGFKTTILLKFKDNESNYKYKIISSNNKIEDIKKTYSLYENIYIFNDLKNFIIN